MANYQLLKADIDAKVYQNGLQEITGENLNAVLNAMVTTLGAEYQFAGVATKVTNPETTDAKVFYIANGKGTYTHFDNIDVTEDDVVILYYDTAWHKIATGIASNDKLTELESNVATKSTTIANIIGAMDNMLAGYITSENQWDEGANYAHTIIAVNPGDTIEMVGVHGSQYTFLKSYTTPKTGVAPDFCNGWVRETFTGTKTETAPDDAKYLYLLRKYSTNNWSYTIKINGVQFDYSARLSDIESNANSSYSRYFALDKTFGLDNWLDAALFRSSLMRCVFYNKPVAERIGIYTWQISNGILLMYFSNCDSLQDNDVITNSVTFAIVQASVTNINGATKLPIMSGGNEIGYVIVDIGKIRKVTNGIQSDTPKTYGNSGISGVEIGEISIVENEFVNMKNNISAVNIFNDWGVRIVGNSNSFVDLKSQIVLAENGDSLEITFGEIRAEGMLSGGYAFTNDTASDEVRGIFISKNQFGLRADNGTWIRTVISQPMDFATLKIEYANDSISYYVNNTLIGTYDGLLTLTTSGFGRGVVSQFLTYWNGDIIAVKHNGNVLDLRNVSTFGTNTYAYRLNGFLTDAQNQALQASKPNLLVAKTTTIMTIYKKLPNGKYVGYPYEYRQRNYAADAYPSYFDNWGIGRPSIYEYNNGAMVRTVYLFDGAEAELAVNLPRGDGQTGAVYVGGGMHGFENIHTNTDGSRKFVILIDKKRYAEDSTFNLMPFETIEILQETGLVQAYTNTNEWATATKHWFFDYNGLRITTSLEITRALQFSQAQFGMFGVERHWDGVTANDYLTNRAIKNNVPYIPFVVTDDWESVSANNQLRVNDKDCTRIAAYGDHDMGVALEIQDATTKPNGGMSMRTNGGQPYNKMYFDLTGSYLPTVGEILKATQIWHIE